MISKIERWAQKYENGDVLAEFSKRMNQFTCWGDLNKDELTLETDYTSLSITIDGTKEAFMKGDALDCIDFSELLGLLRFALELNAFVEILPASTKTLSIKFWWERV